MNRLCPICGKQFTKINNLYSCPSDGLYADLRLPDSAYGDDYVLHYKLYAKTQLSKSLCYARWQFIIRHVELQDKILLDYGCGAGTFAKYRDEDFPQIFMYDPYFSPDHSFVKHDIDVVTLWDSFEHMTRLDIIPTIGAPHVFISLPVIDNVRSLKAWKHYVPHEHIWYFSSKALKKLFEKWRYELVEMTDFEACLRSKDIKSFYFRYW